VVGKGGDTRDEKGKRVREQKVNRGTKDEKGHNDGRAGQKRTKGQCNIGFLAAATHIVQHESEQVKEGDVSVGIKTLERKENDEVRGQDSCRIQYQPSTCGWGRSIRGIKGRSWGRREWVKPRSNGDTTENEQIRQEHAQCVSEETVTPGKGVLQKPRSNGWCMQQGKRATKKPKA